MLRLSKCSVLLVVGTLWIQKVFSLSQTSTPHPTSTGSPEPKSRMKTVFRSSTCKPVKRICIVGAGIAGLSLAHALTNSPSLLKGLSDEFEVSLFDSRTELDYTAGSGVQLNGGMACLGKINPEIQQAVIEAAVPISYLHGRYKAWFRPGEVDKLWDYNVDTIIKSDQRARQELVDKNDTVLWYGIMRGALQETLLEKLPKSDQIKVSFDKTVTGIFASSKYDQHKSIGAMCRFSDGSSAGPFDLIVGCDGIKSVVKEYIERQTISEDPLKRDGGAIALYSGIRVNYAVQENGGVEEKQPQPLQQCFADGAYAFSGIFGNGKNRPPCRCFFVTSLDDRYNGPFRRSLSESTEISSSQTQSLLTTSDAVSENADWTQNVRKPRAETREKMLQQLERYSITDSTAKDIIVNADRFFELGVYFHNPITWKGWSKQVPSSDESYTVLCGDAAHAMPPFLGQGANQAVQDAYCLAQKIVNYNERLQASSDEGNLKRTEPSLRKELKEYQSTRFFPTASITAKATILGYLETGSRDGFYSSFRDVFFRLLDFAGVPVKVLVDSSIPKV